MWVNRLKLFLRTVGREGLILLFALRHPQTPTLVRFATIGLILYTLSPIDLIPDVALLFGLADDVALLVIGIPALVRRLPPVVLSDASARVERLLGRFGFGRG
ncbi:MAG: DUF1232 domain-containing protein [Burkholderiaceae bacterium]|nr:DUF1232 domain-containing protein [Burkholderiaceae bacterium]